jgi:hypothetical protein
MAKKINATELKDVRVDFISFVTEGANGQKFAIFKSKDAKQGQKPEEKVEIGKEEISVLKKLFGKLNIFKQKPNEEELSMADMKKVLTALDDIKKGVDENATKIEEFEEKLEKADPDMGAQGDNNGKPDTSDVSAGDTSSANAVGGDGEANTDAPPADGKDATTEVEKKMMTALEDIKKGLQANSDRLEKLEKKRTPSNSLDGDDPVNKGNGAGEGDDDNVFEGIFG